MFARIRSPSGPKRDWVLLALVSLILFLFAATDDSRAERRRRVRVFNRGLADLIQGRGRLRDLLDQIETGQTGFTTLRQFQNNLFEVDQITGAVRQIRPDSRFPFGLAGVRQRQTIDDLKQFVLQKIDEPQIPGFRNRNQALDFLLRAGVTPQQLSGQITFDLGNISMPETEYAKGADRAKEMEIKTSALNYVINVISASSRLFRLGPGNVGANGLVTANLRGIVQSGALAAAIQGNPYGCSRTGRDPIRLDWFIARAMDPALYYQFIGAPATEQELTRTLGVEINRKNTLGNKIAVDHTESAVITALPQEKRSNNFRISEIQNMRNVLGGSYYKTYDNLATLAPGQQQQAGNVARNGINAVFAAGEMIFHKPNGFMGMYLATADGKRQNSAPAEIAAAKGYCGLTTEVSSPLGCYCCHATGGWDGKTHFLAGGIQHRDGKTPYTENIDKIPSFHRQFFTTNAVYAARARRDSAIFRNALINSGSFVRAKANSEAPAPLMPDFVVGYRTPLTMAKLARELGLGEQAASFVAARLGKKPDQTVERSELEQIDNGGNSLFCRMKAAFAGGATELASSFSPRLSLPTGNSEARPH